MLRRRCWNQFWVCLAIALGVWVLRGFAILAFLPGWVLYLLFLAAAILGVRAFYFPPRRS
jgi:hypothetical protein